MKDLVNLALPATKGNQHESTFFGRIWDMNLYKSIIFTIKHDILGEKRELGWF
jgi:hypothetical protein